MRIKNISTQINMHVYMFVSLLTVSVFVALGVDVYFGIALAIWCVSLFYALFNFKRRMLYCAFLVSFFVFLMSGHFVYEFFGYKLNYYLGYEYYRHSNVLIALSLLSVLIAHYATDSIVSLSPCKRRSRYSSWFDYATSNHTQSIRQISKSLFYLTFPFLVYVEIIQKYRFISVSGYASYYVDFTIKSPFIVRALGNMAPYAFLIFLATMPRKLDCKLILPLFFIYAASSLLTGRRMYFVLTVLLLIMYFFFRNSISVYKDVWLSRRMILLASVLIPVIIIFLFEFDYTRLGRSSGAESRFDQILGFFQQQGFSSSVIRLTKYYESSLNSEVHYSFFSLLKWLRVNSFIGLFFKFNYGFSYLHNSIEYATLGNSLSNSLSLITLGADRYLKGFGVGSCYIAELFFDFSYLGVVIGNFIYGGLMAIVNNVHGLTKNTVWRLAFLFILFDSFVKAPRWNFDIVFAQFLNLAMWSTIIVVFGLSRFLSNKIKLHRSVSHYYTQSTKNNTASF